MAKLWATFGSILATFKTPTSGHTAQNLPKSFLHSAIKERRGTYYLLKTLLRSKLLMDQFGSFQSLITLMLRFFIICILTFW